MGNIQDLSKNHESINSDRSAELCPDLMQLISSKYTIRANRNHLLPCRNSIDTEVLFAETLYGIIVHIKSTDVSRQYIFEYSKGAKAVLGNNSDKGELINPEEHIHDKASFETESVTTQHLLTIESVNESFNNGSGRDNNNNDDPESGNTSITQPKDCSNAHLRFILLVIFSVFTITLLVMIRCSAYRVPSFFRHSPLLLKGFTSCLLLGVIFSLLSLETMAKGNKFTRYFANIAILSATTAVSLFVALALLQFI